MNKQKERDLHPEFILKRRLKLASVAFDKQRADTRLKALVGMAYVKWCDDWQLELRYDASQLQLDQILEVLAQCGAGLKQGAMARMRINWYRMTDRNTWDSSRHVPHCCNKSPK